MHPSATKFFAIASFAFVAACAEPIEEQPEMPSGPVLTTTVAELVQAYEDNELAAQQKYGDRWLEISGTVAGVDLDYNDDPVLLLEADVFGNVQADFEDSSGAELLAKGDPVRIVCSEISEVLGTPILSGCTIQQPI